MMSVEIVLTSLISADHRYQNTDDCQYIAALVLRLIEWYKAWAPIPEYAISISFIDRVILNEHASD